MKLFLLIVLVGISAVNCAEQVSVTAGKGAAAGSGASVQKATGNKIAVSGSASSSSGVNGEGESSSEAEAAGGSSSEGTTESSEATTAAPAEESTAAATEAAPEETTTAKASATTAKAASSKAPVKATSKAAPAKPANKGAQGEAGAQSPGVWAALDGLRGKAPLLTEEIQSLLASAVAGKDYPILAAVPDVKTFDCEKTHQAGFYADTDFQCQVIRRCDTNGILSSYLCPNRTLFNQITLICDWFFNVDCAQATKYYDYSNSRLYKPDQVLLDTPAE
jgi:hypothetical protein